MYEIGLRFSIGCFHTLRGFRNFGVLLFPLNEDKF